MSEVKRYGHISYLVEATPEMVQLYPQMTIYVLSNDFDAQRLRADTAEAELAKLRERHDTVKCQRNDAAKGLAAAEQRIAELSANNQQLRKLLDQALAALNPTAKLSKSIRAALNPNPEAESHE